VLTYLAVWLASTINYLYCGMPLKIIKTTIISAFIWLVFMILIPVYVDELLGWKFVNSIVFFWSSIYIISIPVSIYLIKEQKRNNL
jgi:hypothetical protein